MNARPHLRAIITLALSLLLVGTACGQDTPQNPEETPALVAPQPANDVVPAEEPGCQDYRALDPSTLTALPYTPYTALLEQVWTTALEKHIDPTFGCQDWPALRERYGARLTELDKENRRASAYALINEMLTTLGPGHFRLTRDPKSEEPDDAARVPLRVRLIDDEVVVVEPGDSGVPQGAALVAIGRQKIKRLVARAQAAALRPGERSLAATRLIERALTGRRGDSVKLTYREQGAKRTRTRKAQYTKPVGERVAVGNLRTSETRISARVIEGTSIGYIAFNYWMIPIVNEFTSHVADLRGRGVTAMILDLRGNSGGVGALTIPVAREFLDAPAKLGVLRFRDFEQVLNVAGDSRAFTGPLVLLIDERTASTSEIFATGMRELERVTIIGSGPTAGAALPSIIDRLDRGAILTYVIGEYKSTKGEIPEGTGVTPDILVPETRADIAGGRDPVLEAAVARLSGTE